MTTSSLSVARKAGCRGATTLQRVMHRSMGPAGHQAIEPVMAEFNGREPKVQALYEGELPDGSRTHTKRLPDGSMRTQCYTPPERANPGNVIKCHGGGGHMGSPLAHENEAPFPEDLVTPFVRCFCPVGGVVLDPFCGSGTTLSVALQWGRDCIGIDVRESQIALSQKRVDAILEAVQF